MERIFHYLKLAVVVLGAGTLTGVIVMFIALRDKGDILVPSIQGDDIVTALEKVTGVGLNLKIIELAYDAQAPRNAVISQNPPADAGLKRGRDVRVVISRGVQDIEMPDLRGTSMRQARNMLHPQGLPLPSISKIHSSAVEENHVIAHLPPPDSRVTDHSRVEFLVSLGALPERFILPDFRGLQLNDVVEKIRRAGLKLGRVRYIERDTEESGTVLKQEPSAGRPVKRGREVSLVSARRDSGMASPRTFTVYNFTLPDEIKPGVVRVITENADGDKEVYSRQHKSGDTLSLLVEVAGETTISIYMNDELLEVKRF